MATTMKARIKAGRRTIDLSNPDNRAIAPTMEAYVAGRLLTLERFPDGIDGKRFFQRDAPAYFPDWIERKRVGKRDALLKTPADGDRGELATPIRVQPSRPVTGGPSSVPWRACPRL